MTTRLRLPAALLIAAALLTTGCTEGLRSSAKAKQTTTGNTTGPAITTWPKSRLAGTATGPITPDVTVGVHDVIRSGDGLSTVLLDVKNDGNKDLDSFDLLDALSLREVSLLDLQHKVRYFPLQPRQGSGPCLCSENPDLPAGAVTTLYATFSDLPADIGEVRVTVPQFTPVDGVRVVGVPVFKAGPTAKMDVESNPDLGVRVRTVAPVGPKGTLLRLEYHNQGSDPVYGSDFPRAGDVVLLDPDTMTTYGIREADSSEVLSDYPSGQLEGNRSFTRDLLMAPLPASVHRVIVMGTGIRRSFPVTVSTTQVEPRVDITGTLDAPSTRQLVQTTNRFHTEAVRLAQPVSTSVDTVGAELPKGPVVGKLQSPAQPGWVVAPRNVVRVGTKQAYLLVDVTRPNSGASWPDGLGQNNLSDLSAVALIDPAAHQRLGVLAAGSSALSTDSDDSISAGETRTMFAAFPAPAKGSRSVTVDVPSFGQLAGVPVVAEPSSKPATAAVGSTMRSAVDGRLRMDILNIGRMSGGNGTLVRARMVNESNPDGVDAPWGSTGVNDLCRLALVNADSNDRFEALDPCAATVWHRAVGAGDSLVFEVRFPNLPAGVSHLVVDADGFIPSAPVALASSARPWYLDLPAEADAPSGDTLSGSIGVADDLQSETREGDEVEVNLNTDVLFEFGSATLNPGSAARLLGIADRLATDASGTVTITGYTDSVGDDASNLALSQRRADAVNAVISRISSKSGLSFDVEAKGEADPVAPNDIDGRDNPDGRARNRRVTISYTAS